MYKTVYFLDSSESTWFMWGYNVFRIKGLEWSGELFDRD